MGQLGLFPLLEHLPRRACLIAFNYHRIGHPDNAAYDRGVIEATPEQFEFQMGWLKRNFDVVRLEEAQEMIEDPRRLRHAHVLITFDDGYRDNYDLAFPILRDLGVPATFFLPTRFIGSHHLPWWDRAADLVRRASRRPVVLSYPRHLEVPGGTEASIQKVLGLYKDPATTDQARFLLELEQACGVSCGDSADERVFLSWDEAREMLRGGMSFGSHSHSHEILARMSPDEQRHELSLSRATLQKELGIAAEAFAYPVGAASTFNSATQAALLEAGYRVAFSYRGGANLAGEMSRFDVQRTRVGTDLNDDQFRLRTLCLAVAGRPWV